MKDKVIIITINYRQNEYTLDCIRSILKSTHQNFIIILVDNGAIMESSKELEKMLPKDNRIKFHRMEENLGYVGGINHGLKEGSNYDPDYFMIMNNDTIIDELAISELEKSCKKYEDKAIVTGKEYDYSSPNVLNNIGSVFKNRKMLTFDLVANREEDDGSHDEIKERDLIDDVFWLFPSKLYTLIGGYCEYFWFSSEQADFALRAKKEGYKLVYSPKAKIWHKGSASIGGREFNPALVFYSLQSALIIRFLHLNFFNFVLYYLRILILVIYSFFKAVCNYRKNRNHIIWAYAKLRAILFFNKWIFKKPVNTGYNPFLGGK